MTTRLHRLWQPGNPQTRVFLPNFWMRLVRPFKKEFLPPNTIKFECSLQMSQHDIKEYLRKIYGLPVRNCWTAVIEGKMETTEKMGRYPVFAYDKEDDFKVAYITLPRGVHFEFPELYPTKRKSTLDMAKSVLKQKDDLKSKSQEQFNKDDKKK